MTESALVGIRWMVEHVSEDAVFIVDTANERLVSSSRRGAELLDSSQTFLVDILRFARNPTGAVPEGRLRFSVARVPDTPGLLILTVVETSPVLSSFMSAMLDAYFAVDSEFHILDDTPKLRHLITANPDASVAGMSLELLMTSKDDLSKFREFMARSLEDRAGRGQLTAAASMIQTKLCLAGKCCFVELYASPLPPAPPTSEESTTASTSVNRQGYMMGFRVLSCETSFSNEPPCVDVLASSTSKPSTPSELTAPPRLFRGMQMGQSTGLIYPAVSAIPPPPMADLLTTSAYRSLHQDLNTAILVVNEADLTGPSSCGPCDVDQSPELFIPLYEVSDTSAIEEELVRSLPNDKQVKFAKAAAEGSYLVCSQLMASCLEGNANFLSPFRGDRLCSNADLMHCLIRFYIGLTHGVSGETAYTILLTLSSSLHRVEDILGRRLMPVVRTELTLALLSQAIIHPNWFEAAVTRQWLRESFAEIVAEKPEYPDDKSRRLPYVYWACILWACDRHNAQGTKQILANVFEDIQAYCQRHPACSSARQLEVIICHNLAVISMGEDDFLTAARWSSQLKQILTSEASVIDIPLRCCKMVEWMRVSGHINPHV